MATADYFAPLYPAAPYQSFPYPSPSYDGDDMFSDHSSIHQQSHQPRSLSHSTESSQHSQHSAYTHGHSHPSSFAQYHQPSDFGYDETHAASFETGRVIPVNYTPTVVSMNEINVGDGQSGEERNGSDGVNGNSSGNHSLELVLAKRESHSVGGGAGRGPMPIPVHANHHALSRTPSNPGLTSSPLSPPSSITTAFPTTPTQLHPLPHHPTDTRAYCLVPGCLDGKGHQRSFSRKADVARHHRSAHDRNFIDCPYKKCTRKGPCGFTRNDHLMEHRRQFHMERLPKKSVRSSRVGIGGGGAVLKAAREMHKKELRERFMGS